MSKVINEITGSGSIAAVPMGSGSIVRRDKVADREWVSDIKNRKETPQSNSHNKTKEQLDKARELLQKRKKQRFKDFANKLFSRRDGIKEDFDMNGIVSRLKSLEAKNSPKRTDTTTYGVEDDSGNIMKITVKNDQAKNFEARLALEMGELENNKMYGYEKTDVSLAELLYNLKDEFDIIDVEFPEIPSDVVYNADRATYGMNPDNVQNNDEFDLDNDLDSDLNNDMGGEFDSNQPMGDDSQSFDQNQEGDELDDDFVDNENVEEFDETMPQESPESSLYKELIQMLTKQAEATKAQAEAEAEKARALQAEYSAKSANVELSRQEELARMEAELDKKKEKEKEVKRMADLAKYRVQQNSNSFESYSPLMQDVLKNIVTEDDSEMGSVESEQVVRKQMTMAKTRYAPIPTDDPATANYKRQMLATTINELNAKLRKARLAINRQQQLKNSSVNNQATDQKAREQAIDKSL